MIEQLHIKVAYKFYVRLHKLIKDKYGSNSGISSLNPLLVGQGFMLVAILGDNVIEVPVTFERMQRRNIAKIILQELEDEISKQTNIIEID